MTRDQIGRLAEKAIREAGRESWTNEWIEVFTHYVQQYEREACAKVADGMLLEKAGEKASVVYSGDVGAAIKRRENH